MVPEAPSYQLNSSKLKTLRLNAPASASAFFISDLKYVHSAYIDQLRARRMLTPAFDPAVFHMDMTVTVIRRPEVFQAFRLHFFPRRG